MLRNVMLLAGRKKVKAYWPSAIVIEDTLLLKFDNSDLI